MKMAQTKRFWLPYASYDLKNIQEFLMDKAQEGYRLKKIGAYFPVFEEIDRDQPVVYHFEPTVKDAQKPTEELKKSREDRGWVYAGTLSDFFHVFYAEKNEDDFYGPEHSMGAKFEEKLKKERRALLFILPSTALYIFSLLLRPSYESFDMWLYLKFNWLIVLSILLYGVTVISKIIHYHKLKTIMRDLEEENRFTVSSSKTFKVIKVFGSTVILGFMAFFLLQLFTSAKDWTGFTYPKEDAGIIDEVALKVQEAYEEHYSFVSEEDFNGNYQDFPSILLPKREQIMHYMGAREGFKSSHVGYTEAINEKVAKNALQVIMESDLIFMPSETSYDRSDQKGVQHISLVVYDNRYHYLQYGKKILSFRFPLDFQEYEEDILNFAVNQLKEGDS